jgi:putative nucleotidyltransferase with HDIG domain
MESRLVYRAHQFWKAITASRKHIPDSELSKLLAPTQVALFKRMQPSEQFHAYQVYWKLVSTGWKDRELLSAALLHDVGKILHPLSVVDRVIIVMGNRLFPRKSARWATGEPEGLRKPFVVAKHHAAWGAELAKKAGISRTGVDIILHHQDSIPSKLKGETEIFLSALQAADNEN